MTWPEPDGYSPRAPGLYVFTAAIPEPYTLAEDIEAPSLSFMQAGLSRIAGYGTEGAPLEIRNAEQLAEVAALVNAGTLETTVFGANSGTVYLELMNDIALSGNWTPIGDFPDAFKGVFDGGGHTITGFTITDGGNIQGLFGHIYGGTVKDLTLKDVNVSGNNVVGGVAGDVDGGSIENCTVSGSVSGSDDVGGVAGTVSGGSVTSCYALGPSVTASDQYLGRVVGYFYGGTLYNNKAWAGMEVNGNTTSSEDATSKDGEDISSEDAVAYLKTNGIDVPAHLLTGGSIREIHTAEDLQAFRDDVNSGNSYSDETVTLMDDIDLSSIGNWTPIGTMSYPFSGEFNGNGKTITGLTISADSDHQGLFGNVFGGSVNDLTLKDVNVSGSNEVGGVTGRLEGGSMTGCVVTGSVSGYAYVGGVAGTVYDSSVENCVSTGSASGDGSVGGVAGLVSGGSVTGCYALSPSVTGGSYTGRVVGNYIMDILDNNKAWENMPGGGSNKTADGEDGADISTAEAVAYLTDKGIPIPEHLRESGNITEIWTQADLEALATDVNGGITYSGLEVMLMDNITLSGNWTPIGNTTLPFRGTFDGGGKTITGLSITGSGNYQGLFGVIRDGTVKNLTLKDVSVSGTDYVGGVTGAVRNGGRIENCVITGSINGVWFVGGVAGYVGGSVTGCVSTGSVSGYDVVGGVVGIIDSGGSVTGCAALNPSVTGDSYTGRVVGDSDSTLDNNVAWAGMDIKVSGSAKDPLDEGYDRVDGHGLSMEEIEEQYEDIFNQGGFHLRRSGISGADVTLNPPSYTYDGNTKRRISP